MKSIIMKIAMLLGCIALFGCGSGEAAPGQATIEPTQVRKGLDVAVTPNEVIVTVACPAFKGLQFDVYGVTMPTVGLVPSDLISTDIPGAILVANALMDGSIVVALVAPTVSDGHTITIRGRIGDDVQIVGVEFLDIIQGVPVHTAGEVRIR